MGDRRAKFVSVSFVIAILVLSSLGILAGLGAAASSRHAGTSGLALSSNYPGPTTQTARTHSGLPHAGDNLKGPTAEATPNPVALTALAQARASGVPTSDVFVPRAAATPSQQAQAQTQGYVTPLYGGIDPAPIGLADYGLSANPNGNGSVIPSLLNTPSVMATFAPNATGVQPLYPFSSTPDGYGVQLNAVSTDVSLFGTNNYSFWTQNVVEYEAQAHELILVTNVWNFSGNSLSANVFYAHGPYGFQVGTTFYYSEEVVPFPVTYPFNLALWMNNSVISGRNAVNFTVALTDSGVTTVYPYDYVIFNSTTLTSGPAAPSNYTANGYQYNAFGLTNDFEVILGGPGGGSQANLYAADANFTLQYWNTSTSSYQTVPSAFSYGGETGETVTGAYVGWQNDSQGAPYGLVRTGPAILDGLWNATGAPGLAQIQLTLTPGNLWLFVAPNWTSNFTYQGQPYWAPQEWSYSTLWLSPGSYILTAELSNYDPASINYVASAGLTTVGLTLTANSLQGTYTPLWVWNNSQFAAISTGGAGTPSNPYQITTDHTTVMSSIFGTWNDFTFPVFTGVFFWGTSASVVMSNMGPLVTAMPNPLAAPLDSLGYVLYNASNVALVNSTQISGWYSDGLYNPVAYPSYAGNYYATFSVVLWNSSSDLIANDTFETQSGGLSLYGGTSNTVWGNTFTMAPFPVFPNPGQLSGLNQSLGLQEVESGDVIYNNAFDTTTTAVTEPLDLYNGFPISALETWNITPTPAATVHYTLNFPDLPLTGTIIGNATQGGNFWWDYGGSSNPTGVLPYTEVVGGVSQIISGGDSYPLVLSAAPVYTATFSESGLPAGTSWQITLNGIHSSTATSIQLPLSNGSYPWTVGAVAGYLASPLNGTLLVAGAAVNVSVTFTPGPTSYLVRFSETGLPSGTSWTVVLGSQTLSSSTALIDFQATNGTYSFAVHNVSGYVPTPLSGQAMVQGASQVIPVSYASTTPTYTLTFSESGLPTGTRWSVTVTLTVMNSTGTQINFSETPGTHGYEIGSVAGYQPTPASGSAEVLSSNATILVTFTLLPPGEYTLTFTESGLTTGTSWSVAIGSTTMPSTGTTLVFTEPNGTYDYTVAAVPGYTLTQASGSVTVAGVNTGTGIVFSAVAPGKFALTFTESGLPSPTNWSVTIGTSTVYSNGGNVVSFQEANGNISYQVGSVSGYAASPGSGVVQLAGAAKNVAVTFTSSGSSSPSSSGLTTLDWAIIAVVILLLVFAAVFALSRRGRGGNSRGNPPEHPEGENSSAEVQEGPGNSP
ncbi:MAG: thermopsin family protease [Thermoplasmata archaeon]|nr:thermopsin family protease [Thermoplasmata archaeon]